MNKNKIIKFLKEIYPYLIIIAVVLVIKAYIVAPIMVSGSSMDSTLKNGDIMILQKIGYNEKTIKRFDIIVINYNNKPLIKRVIGLPGDKVESISGTLYINDEKIDEPYLDKDTYTKTFSIEQLFDVEKIPEGYYFVLGDNREVSIDSRTIGLISIDNIMGKASLVIYPFNRIGIKE